LLVAEKYTCDEVLPLAQCSSTGILQNMWWGLFFFGHRLKCFWNDRKKWSHFGRMFENIGYKTLLQWVLMQLWDKWSKCFSDQNVSVENDRNVSVKKNRVEFCEGSLFYRDNSFLLQYVDASLW